MNTKVVKPRTTNEPLHVEVDWQVVPQYRVWDHDTYTERFENSGDDDPVTHLRISRMEKRAPVNARGAVRWSEARTEKTLTFRISLDEVSALSYAMTDWVAFLLQERVKKEDASA